MAQRPGVSAQHGTPFLDGLRSRIPAEMPLLPDGTPPTGVSRLPASLHLLEKEPNRLTYPMEVSILGILGVMIPFESTTVTLGVFPGNVHTHAQFH